MLELLAALGAPILEPNLERERERDFLLKHIQRYVTGYEIKRKYNLFKTFIATVLRNICGSKNANFTIFASEISQINQVLPKKNSQLNISPLVS